MRVPPFPAQFGPAPPWKFESNHWTLSRSWSPAEKRFASSRHPVPAQTQQVPAAPWSRSAATYGTSERSENETGPVVDRVRVAGSTAAGAGEARS